MPLSPIVSRTAAAALLAACAGACAAGYRVTPLGRPAWWGSTCWGINARGDTVGEGKVTLEEFGQVAWTAGPAGRVRATGFGAGRDAAGAYAINASGTTVGEVITDQTFGFHYPAAWAADGTRTQLAPDGTALALNDAGDIVGSTSGSNGYPYAALWAGGQLVDLAPTHLYSEGVGINGRRQVVGNADGVAVLWAGGMETPLGTFGGQYSEAAAINAAGHAVGDADLPGDRRHHAFLWVDGALRDLGAPEGGSSSASAINNDDVVVGNFTPDSARFHAFVWHDGRMRLLDDLLDPVTGAGWHFTAASGINDAGAICADSDAGAALLTPME